MQLLTKIKTRRERKEALKQFREKLTIGTKVIVDYGEHIDIVQVVGIRDEVVRIIDKNMSLGAYPIQSIYPILSDTL